MGVRNATRRDVGEVINRSGGVKNGVSTYRIGVDTDNAAAIGINTIITRDADGNASVYAQGGTAPLGVVTNIYRGVGESAGGASEGLRNNVLPASTAGSLEYVAFADGFGLRLSEDADAGVISTSSNSGWADLVAQSIIGNDGETVYREPIATELVDSSTFATSAGSLEWKVTRIVAFDTVSIGGTGTNYGTFDCYPVTYLTP